MSGGESVRNRSIFARLDPQKVTASGGVVGILNHEEKNGCGRKALAVDECLACAGAGLHQIHIQHEVGGRNTEAHYAVVDLIGDLVNAAAGKCLSTVDAHARDVVRRIVDVVAGVDGHLEPVDDGSHASGANHAQHHGTGVFRAGPVDGIDIVARAVAGLGGNALRFSGG